MAREIVIQNNKLFKRSLSIDDIIGKDNYGYGVYDEHFRLDKDEKTGGILIVYDEDQIGRGIQLADPTNKQKMRLAISIPTTEHDIRMLYKLAGRVASLWSAKHIYVDGEKVELSAIDSCIQHDIEVSRNMLKDAVQMFGNQNTLFPCAVFPIAFSPAQLQEFAANPELFSAYLHERQNIDAYYSAPLYHQVNDMYLVLYVVFDNSYIILPNTPKTTVRSEGNEVSCDQSLVVCSNLFPDEELSQISFSDFLDRVPEDKKSVFDVSHTLIAPMSTEELQAIFRQE